MFLGKYGKTIFETFTKFRILNLTTQCKSKITKGWGKNNLLSRMFKYKLLILGP